MAPVSWAARPDARGAVRRIAPVLLVFCASAAAMGWRAAGWPPSQSTDAYSYGAWGQQITRFEAPLYDRTLTTPKPLGIALGAVTSPLPPQRAFQAAVLVFLAGLAAALFWAAYREGGTVGAVVAMVALATSAVLGVSLRLGLIDGVAAALVMLALVTGGRARYAALVLAGLARPEAWLVSGVAVFAGVAGDRRRRVALAALGAAAAPAAWALFDLAATGDPLATTDRADAIVNVVARGWSPPGPTSLVSGLVDDAGLVVVLAGSAGLVLQAVRERREGTLDVLPLAVIVLWAAALVVETRRVPFSARYMFAMAVPLLVGSAIAAGALVPARLRGSAGIAAVAAAAAFVLTAATIPAPSCCNIAPMRQAVPAIQEVVACGPMLVTANQPQTPGRRAHRAQALLPLLAALSHRSLGDFTTVDTGDEAGILAIRGHGPPGWRTRRYLFGTVSISPACPKTASRS
jgi:hypothetical protein